MDGQVIEMVSHRRYPNVVGVQFHPEHRLLFDGSVSARITSTDDRKHNSMAKTLRSDPATLRLHQFLWRLFDRALSNGRVTVREEAGHLR